jgi:hypothetical protein
VWSVLGYIAAFLLFAAPVAAIGVWLGGRRRFRIRPAGWAPWWYVGGQPDVPEELQARARSRSRRQS